MRLEEDLGLALLFKLRGPVEPPGGIVIVNTAAEPFFRPGLQQPEKVCAGHEDAGRFLRVLAVLRVGQQSGAAVELGQGHRRVQVVTQCIEQGF